MQIPLDRKQRCFAAQGCQVRAHEADRESCDLLEVDFPVERHGARVHAQDVESLVFVRWPHLNLAIEPEASEWAKGGGRNAECGGRRWNAEAGSSS